MGFHRVGDAVASIGHCLYTRERRYTGAAAPADSRADRHGSFIRLRVDTPFNGAWTSVEWQDAIGNWHPVEGWQGTLEADGTKTWWVAEADRGKGPFRWVLDDRRGGKSVGISSAFNLPSGNRQVVEIKLTANR